MLYEAAEAVEALAFEDQLLQYGRQVYIYIHIYMRLQRQLRR